MENLKEITFNLFEQYEDYEDIIDSLRSLNSENAISDEDYHYIMNKYAIWLKEFELGTKANYFKNVCNFLNNIKGYITKEEIEFLLECIGNKEYHITDENVNELSDLVECDKQEEFLEELIKLEMVRSK